MKFLTVYARLYASCAAQAVKGIGRNPWTLLLPMGLVMGLGLLAPVVGLLGVLSGLALALLLDAAFSCYLYFTGEVVAHSKVSLSEFKRSIGAYFWSVVSLSFVVWLVSLLLGTLLGRTPQGPGVLAAFNILVLVALNAAPEVIYQRGTRHGLETVQRSVRFLQENWVEWFVPNAAFLAIAYLWLRVGLLGGAVGFWLTALVGGALVHVLMVFRGHLFQVLDGSTHRQRMFRYRNAGAAD